MTREEAEAFLTEAGKLGDAGFPLFEAAIACAVHDDPDRDAAATSVPLGEIAALVRSRIRV